MYEKVDIPVPFVGDWCGKYAERKDPERVSKDAAFANLGMLSIHDAIIMQM